MSLEFGLTFLIWVGIALYFIWNFIFRKSPVQPSRKQQESAIKWISMRGTVKYVNDPKTGSAILAKGAQYPPHIDCKRALSMFSKGAMRKAYNLKFTTPTGVDFIDDGKSISVDMFVAKTYHDEKVPKDEIPTEEAYKDDLVLQYAAKELANKYNSLNPPKKISFVDAVLLELEPFPNPHFEKPKFYFVEPFMEGEFKKFSNNWDWTDNSRATPHAFSHFTLQKSKETLVVVDMQGVGDVYTDPQIHTNPTFWHQFIGFFRKEKANMSTKEFGLGNGGEDGIKKFKEAHICSPLCESLGLKKLNKKKWVSTEPSNSSSTRVITKKEG